MNYIVDSNKYVFLGGEKGEKRECKEFSYLFISVNHNNDCSFVSILSSASYKIFIHFTNLNLLYYCNCENMLWL